MGNVRNTRDAQGGTERQEGAPGSGIRRRGLRRGAPALALCLLTGAVLAACSGGDDSASSSDSPSAATASPSTGDSAGTGTTGDSDGTGSEQPGSNEPTAPQSSSPSASHTGPPNSAKPSAPATSKDSTARGAGDRCTSAGMRLTLGRGDAGAGNIHYSLVFTNTSGKSCTLSGYPGVSALAGDGQQIGAPATREGGAGSAVRLAPGARAYSVVHTLNEGIDGGCRDKGALLRAYPPGSREAMTTRSEGLRVCGDTFTITTLKSGAGPS